MVHYRLFPELNSPLVFFFSMLSIFHLCFVFAKEVCCILYDKQVNVTLKKPGTKLEHQGIKIELIGERERANEFCQIFLFN